MTKFKAKADGYQYKKGDILELIQKEADGCSRYQLKDGTVYAWDDKLVELKNDPKFTKGDRVRIIGNSIVQYAWGAEMFWLILILLCLIILWLN